MIAAPVDIHQKSWAICSASWPAGSSVESLPSTAQFSSRPLPRPGAGPAMAAVEEAQVLLLGNSMGSHSLVRRVPFVVALSAIVAACGASSRLTESHGTGPQPELPQPE